ncbi:hypothetical protein ACTJJB_01715 [Chitinophaga sp. 22536]|uniref:hypothetical protein n=1 Tax=unclassified Chitinophaga TaxID=2619133 RepID=UPI003F84E6F8
MQDEKTLIELGFRKNYFGEWFFRGKHRIFTAKVIDYNPPVTYVRISIVSEEIDMRPLSNRRGRHFQTSLKDCCSEGSVARAIEEYDTGGI